jgi:hypothetical protein
VSNGMRGGRTKQSEKIHGGGMQLRRSAVCMATARMGVYGAVRRRRDSRLN